MTPCYKRGKGVQGGSYNNEDIFSFLCRQALVTEGGKVLLLGRGREAPRDRRNCVSRLLLPSTKPDCKLLMMAAMLILLLIMLPLEMWMVVIVKITIENDNYERHPK